MLDLAHPRLPADRHGAFDTYARECFDQFDGEDLTERRAEDLAGALLSHWQFGSQRQPGAAKVRVLSPTVAEDGWTSRHNVVQIVNDDMPFLVDSTTVELNRLGLTIQLLVHPVFAAVRDAAGVLQSMSGAAAAAPGARRESWMHVEVDRLVDPGQRAEVVRGIEKVLADVRVGRDAGLGV